MLQVIWKQFKPGAEQRTESVRCNMISVLTPYHNVSYHNIWIWKYMKNKTWTTKNTAKKVEMNGQDAQSWCTLVIPCLLYNRENIWFLSTSLICIKLCVVIVEQTFVIAHDLFKVNRVRYSGTALLGGRSGCRFMNICPAETEWKTFYWFAIAQQVDFMAQLVIQQHTYFVTSSSSIYARS